MGFGRTGRRAGARRTLDRTQAQAALLNQLRQARHDIKERSHVARLFLYPNYFASVGMGIKSGGDFGTRQRIELVEKQYRGTGVFTLAAFGFQFVADFSAGDENVLGVGDVAVRDYRQKVRLGEIRDRRASIRMAQHAFRRENNKRFAPRPPRLTAQHMEILRGVRRLADLDVVLGGELQKTFEASAGVFRPLAFKSMRQQQHDAGRQIPLVFARADELVDDHLRAVHKVAELRFPQNQSFGIVAAEAVFKPEAARFR